MKRTPNHQQKMSTKPSLIFFAAAAGVEPALMPGRRCKYCRVVPHITALAASSLQVFG